MIIAAAAVVLVVAIAAWCAAWVLEHLDDEPLDLDEMDRRACEDYGDRVAAGKTRTGIR